MPPWCARARTDPGSLCQDGLWEDGVSADVVDLRNLKPLDEVAFLLSAHKTGRLVIVQEASGLRGVAAEVAALAGGLAFDALAPR